MTQPAHLARTDLSPAAASASRERRADWWRADPGFDAAIPAAADSRPHGSAVPFGALMTFTFILLLAPQTFIPELASARIALLAALAAIASHLLDCFVHREPIFVATPELRIAGCLVGWALLTAPLSYWPGGSVFFVLDFYLKTLAIFWLLGSIVNSLTRLRRVAWGLSLMGVPLAATAIANFGSGAYMTGANRILGYNAPLTGNPNDLALTLNLFLPMTVALLLIHRRLTVRALLLAIVLLDVVAVVVTFSRAGFVALVTILAAYLGKLLRRPPRAWALAAVVIVLLGIPFLPAGYFDRVATIADIESDPTGSAPARWNDMLVAARWVLDHPIVGAGIGMNGVALNEARGPHWALVHNVYLEYAVELGIPGLVLFLLLLVRSVKNATFVRRQCARLPAFRQQFHLAEGIQVSLLAFAVSAFFHPVAYHFYFYYVAGLAVAIRTLHVTEAKIARDHDRLGSS